MICSVRIPGCAYDNRHKINFNIISDGSFLDNLVLIMKRFGITRAVSTGPSQLAEIRKVINAAQGMPSRLIRDELVRDTTHLSNQVAAALMSTDKSIHGMDLSEQTL